MGYTAHIVFKIICNIITDVYERREISESMLKPNSRLYIVYVLDQVVYINVLLLIVLLGLRLVHELEVKVWLIIREGRLGSHDLRSFIYRMFFMGLLFWELGLQVC